MTIQFTLEVDGEQVSEEYTAEDVNDRRVTWNPDVARSYAQSIAVDRHGYEIDVGTVEVTQMGKPASEYDETGGTPL